MTEQQTSSMGANASDSSAPEQLPSVLIVLPAFNEQQYVGACLTSLAELDYPDDLLTIVVADNGSTDNTAAIVAEFGVQCLAVPDVNVGAVRNAGARFAASELLAFIDADCLVSEDWLKRAVQTLDDCDAHVAGGTSRVRDDPAWVESAWVLRDPTEGQRRAATILEGCSIVTTRKAFESVGGFNETIPAGEDTLLFEAYRLAGFDVIFDPRLTVVHLGYPRTLLGFIKRQIWQASDYLQSNRGLIGDPVYLLTWLSLLLILLMVVYSPARPGLSLAFAVLWLSIAAILSFKRLNRAGWPGLAPLSYLQIYMLDCAYLLGRTLGLVQSLGKFLRRKFMGQAGA